MYVNNLLLTSSNWEEHCERVQKVLDKFATGNITLKLEKSKLMTSEVQFLGFILSPKGITVVTEKIEAIQKFPQPKHLKQL